ncbi:hypothetical protein B9G69_001975 [Bdellovibrio sp. SKB1291214]|uniref:hypothetical protein n=1 Tax=Bdellovibrio sp. SKB1291214 TaxID=1732569 RepID=UPI000B514BEA|nr:hypothetical protein [Bdellovibrio sp. SKB1291214]UYL09339.1 hypothetical protein B9G69_001975 [Bdellovibrio sp. SKB1291214]
MVGAISIAVVAITVLATTVLSQVSARTELASKDRNDQSALGLKTRLEMLFTHHDLCRQNLRTGAFGKTINEALQSSEQGTIRIVDAHYTPSNTSPKILFGSGSTSRGIKISKIAFVPITPSSSAVAFAAGSELRGTKSYLVNLKIDFESSLTVNSRSIEIPFYFATNGGGVFTDCFASTLPYPEKYPGKTLEDFLCQEISGPIYFFDPESKMCIDGTVYP